MPQAHTVNCTGLTGPSVFAPLAETLFFAARPFHPPKNDSLGPRVPMSTFTKPSEPMLPRNCRRTGGKGVAAPRRRTLVAPSLRRRDTSTGGSGMD